MGKVVGFKDLCSKSTRGNIFFVDVHIPVRKSKTWETMALGLNPNKGCFTSGKVSFTMSQLCVCVADAPLNTNKSLFEQKPEMKVGVIRLQKFVDFSPHTRWECSSWSENCRESNPRTGKRSRVPLLSNRTPCCKSSGSDARLCDVRSSETLSDVNQATCCWLPHWVVNSTTVCTGCAQQSS